MESCSSHGRSTTTVGFPHPSFCEYVLLCMDLQPSRKTLMWYGVHLVLKSVHRYCNKISLNVIVRKLSAPLGAVLSYYDMTFWLSIIYCIFFSCATVCDITCCEVVHYVLNIAYTIHDRLFCFVFSLKTVSQYTLFNVHFFCMFV